MVQFSSEQGREEGSEGDEPPPDSQVSTVDMPLEGIVQRSESEVELESLAGQLDDLCSGYIVCAYYVQGDTVEGSRERYEFFERYSGERIANLDSKFDELTFEDFLPDHEVKEYIEKEMFALGGNILKFYDVCGE